jgi:protein TonB
MSPAGVSSADRLAWAGFLAATLHGLLILGVGFSPGDAPAPADVPTLEVTLLQDPRPDQHEPEDPDYLAQANQQGAGNTAPTFPAPSTATVWSAMARPAL